MNETIRKIRERCLCGAEFEIEGEEYLLTGPLILHERWQEEHALVCDTMKASITPRLERLVLFEAKRVQEGEERRAKRREYNQRKKAEREAAKQ